MSWGTDFHRKTNYCNICTLQIFHITRIFAMLFRRIFLINALFLINTHPDTYPLRLLLNKASGRGIWIPLYYCGRLSVVVAGRSGK